MSESSVTEILILSWRMSSFMRGPAIRDRVKVTVKVRVRVRYNPL